MWCIEHDKGIAVCARTMGESRQEREREREEIEHPDTKVPLVSCTYNLLNMHHSIAVSSFAVASHSFHVP